MCAGCQDDQPLSFSASSGPRRVMSAVAAESASLQGRSRLCTPRDGGALPAVEVLGRGDAELLDGQTVRAVSSAAQIIRKNGGAGRCGRDDGHSLGESRLPGSGTSPLNLVRGRGRGAGAPRPRDAGRGRRRGLRLVAVPTARWRVRGRAHLVETSWRTRVLRTATTVGRSYWTRTATRTRARSSVKSSEPAAHCSNSFPPTSGRADGVVCAGDGPS